MTNSLQVIEELTAELAKGEEKLIAKQRDHLIEKNQELTGNAEGFLVGGMFFSNLSPKQIQVAKKYPVHADLYDEATLLANSAKKFRQDLQRLRQHLVVLLRGCTTAQDMRDALPDPCAQFLSCIRGMPRTRPVAWTIADNPILMHEYEQNTKQAIYYFISLRMLS